MSQALSTFKYLDHTADIGIAVTATTIDDLFRESARGLISLFIEPDGIEDVREKEIHLEFNELDTLLFNWLNEILYWFDAERFIPSTFDAVSVSLQGDELFTLHGMVSGDTFDPERHTIRTYVKAVTYHHLSIEQTEDGCHAQFFVDV